MVQVNLRIRERLRLRIEEAAKANNNSLNDELVGLIERTFKSEELAADLAAKNKALNDWLDAMTRRLKRQGRVLAGWLESEIRKLGVDEREARNLADVARAYWGGESGDPKRHGEQGWIDAEDSI
jgi:hypothetical protein